MRNFFLVGVDHVCVETENVEKIKRIFVNKLNFLQCVADSEDVVKGKCRIKIRPPQPQHEQQRSNFKNSIRTDAAVDVGSTLESTATTTTIDSLTDVSFVVTNLDNLMTRLRSFDQCLILQEVVVVESHPRLGTHRKAIVKSIVGNVMHTLIEIDSRTLRNGITSSNERRFTSNLHQTGSSRTDASPPSTISTSAASPSITSPLAASPLSLASSSVATFDYDGVISNLDHIAIACRVGESDSILRWYEKAFDMKSFDFGENGDGIEIQTDDLGMRLKAMEFWMCSEKVLYPSGGTMERFPLLVVAEPLPGMDRNNQIDVFIDDHGGPGIQHLGLCTDDICLSKSQMKDNGVEFIEPPPTYYSEIGKLDDIRKSGENPTKLQQHGILIDYEDFETRNVTGFDSGYLMQVFTKPIFDRRTFFFELIERRGARGFGAGNITALFKAVQAYMRDGL